VTVATAHRVDQLMLLIGLLAAGDRIGVGPVP
jgi:hypothetical protein